MLEKMQIIFSKSLYYEGAYELRKLSPEIIIIELDAMQLQIEAENLEIQLMVERELYMTFDRLTQLHIAHHREGAKWALSSD